MRAYFNSFRLLMLCVLVALVLMLLAPSVQAATGYSMVATGGISTPTQAAAWTGDRVWKYPAPTDYVLSYPSAPADSSTISYGDANLQFRQFSSIPSNYGILTCTVNLSPSDQAIPSGGTDHCAPGMDPAKKVFVLKTAVQTAESGSTSAGLYITWNNPTAGCTVGVTPCDNAPLTGDAALTAIQVFIATSPIAPNSIMSPTLTLPAGTQTASYSMTVDYGTTVYVRVKAANSYGLAAFSDQAFVLIATPSGGSSMPVPSAPTSVTLELTINPP